MKDKIVKFINKNHPKHLKPNHADTLSSELHKCWQLPQKDRVRQFHAIINSYADYADKDPKLAEKIEKAKFYAKNTYNIEFNAQVTQKSDEVSEKIREKEDKINKAKNLESVKNLNEFASYIPLALQYVAGDSDATISLGQIDEMKKALTTLKYFTDISLMKKCMVSWIMTTDWFRKIPESNEDSNPLKISSEETPYKKMMAHFKDVHDNGFNEEYNEALNNLDEYLKKVKANES